MIHQPHLGGGGIGGQVTDIEIHARELVKTKEKLTRIYETHTGKSYEDLFKAMERDNFMSPTDAKEYGLIDTIVESRKVSQKGAL
jgi:ATP-dependent Clp protease, protease subunit